MHRHIEFLYAAGPSDERQPLIPRLRLTEDGQMAEVTSFGQSSCKSYFGVLRKAARLAFITGEAR